MAAGHHQTAIWHERVPGTEEHVVHVNLGESGRRSRCAGSQIRGIPMVSATSVLPQAKIFPFGIRLMCSGTMSQSTTGPHLPDVASVGSGDKRHRRGGDARQFRR